jgi:hypothetical protein
MADELVLSLRATFAKGVRAGNTDDMGLDGLEIDVSGTDFVGPFTQTIGLTAEAVHVGDIVAGGGTVGYVIGKNISATTAAYVNLSNGAAGAVLAKAFGGDIFCFRLATGATLYADAETTAQEILFWIVEA